MARQPTNAEIGLAALAGLGPVSARLLIEADIADAAALRERGAIDCYRALRSRFGRRATANFIYAIECAIRGIHWRALDAARKAELREAARQIVAALEQRRRP